MDKMIELQRTIRILIPHLVILVISLFIAWYFMKSTFIGLVKYQRLKKSLTKKGITISGVVEGIQNEVREFSGYPEIIVKIYRNIGYDAFIHRGIIVISIDWLADFISEGYNSIRSFDELYITICHELGHHYYKDDNTLNYRSSFANILKIRLKEIRADLYAKQISGFSNEEFASIMEKKIQRAHYSTTETKYSDHPSWNTRIFCARNFNTYEKNEEEIKQMCKDKLPISIKQLACITINSSD